MQFTKIMSMDMNDLIEILQQGKININAKSSWSGENSKQSFKPETEREIEVVLFYKSSDFEKITEQDIDDLDIMRDDIILYDEYRNKEEFCAIIEDCEYIEQDCFKEWIEGQIDDIGYVELNLK